MGKITFFVYIFQAEPDLESEFEWDGRDAYGQRVLGMAEVRIRAAYRYTIDYPKTNHGKNI